MSGESGSAFQPVYLESVYIAAISSARGSHCCVRLILREKYSS